MELAVDELAVLNASKVPPFYVNEEQPGLDETIRLTYRYVDLRRPPMQARIMLRARLASAVRRAFEAMLVRRDRDAEPDPQHAGGCARLRSAVAYAAGQLLRAATEPAGAQAAADGGRLRPLLPDGTRLPRRGSARRPPAGAHPDRRRDELRPRGGRDGHHRGDGHDGDPRGDSGAADPRHAVSAPYLRGGARAVRVGQAGHALRDGAARPDRCSFATWTSGSSPSPSPPGDACGASWLPGARATRASRSTS